MTRIREILLTQYIGAIVAAFMLVDGISSFVSAVSGAVLTGYLRSNINVFPSSWGAEMERTLGYGSTIALLIRAALFLGVFFALIRWLYPPTPSPKADAAATGDQR